MLGKARAVASFLLLVVLIHLDDVEDEANDGNDQQTQLNGVRERYHKPSPPFNQNGEAKEAPSVPVRTRGRTHRLPFIGSTLTDRIS